jgi:hypothetical protein
VAKQLLSGARSRTNGLFARDRHLVTLHQHDIPLNARLSQRSVCLSGVGNREVDGSGSCLGAFPELQREASIATCSSAREAQRGAPAGVVGKAAPESLTSSAIR